MEETVSYRAERDGAAESDTSTTDGPASIQYSSVPVEKAVWYQLDRIAVALEAGGPVADLTRVAEALEQSSLLLEQIAISLGYEPPITEE